MSSFVLKIIGIIAMLCDHSGYLIFGKFSFLNYIGRLALPIFAFSISEGYKHTKDIKKYIIRLFVFALISQIPYTLFRIFILNVDMNLNILFSLLIGLIAILIYEKMNNKILGFILVFIIALLINISNVFDYSWYAIAIIFIFYLFKDKKLIMNFHFIIATFIYILFKYLNQPLNEHWIILLFYIMSLIPINLYNNKKGYNAKYLFYIFYPIHFLILYLINLFA